MKEYLLFDLDGTLTDPKVGITTCVQYALKEFGIEEPDLDKLEPFIGPPLKDSFVKYYNFSDEDAEKAIAKYRERFSEIGLFENEVYAGIPQMLRQLQSRGMFLAVASSKPTEYVERILEHFDLRKYFKVVVGSELDGTRVNKDEVVMEALNRLFSYKQIAYDKVYMIGDRKFDIDGAKAVGVESVGVTYGYGSMEELKEAHADYIVRSVEELQTLLMREAEALKEARDARQQGKTPQGEPKKSLWTIVFAFGYPLLIFMLVRSVAGNVLMSFLQLLSTSPKSALTDWLFVYEEGQLAALTGNCSAILNALVYTIAAGCLFKYVKRAVVKTKENDRLKHIKADSVKSYVLFGIITVCAVVGLNVLLEMGGMTDKAAAYQLYAEDQYSANFIIGMLSTCVVIPIVEEMVFRGAIFNALKKLYKIPAAILMSGLLYGLLNQDSAQGMYGAVLGCLAAYVYEYYGNFLAPVVLHVAASILAYVITYTPLVNTGLYSGPVGVLAAVGAVVAFRMVMKEKKLW